ncbi:MAG: chromophore lyase CpcT/CpeT 1 [Ignavibacterium sp.]|nr:MAG: chromophore lyase CpcT/CpeT 1 [Ignavibacterium sp.]
MKKLLSLFFVVFLSTQISAQINSDIDVLLSWMIGSFNSEEQSKNDSDYYNISLEMHRIWNSRNDGYWLYVEQAVAANKDKPYRQRIYYIFKDNDVIKSVIYSIPDEKNFVGGWKDISLFDKLSPENLEARDGCEVIIKRKDENTFIGSTVDKNCTSNLRGATYATTEVVITKDKMISWDRGFNDKDEQVWGAEKGGYIFNKLQK